MGRTLVSLKSMVMTLKQEKQGIIIELSHAMATIDSPQECPQEIDKVIQEFEAVFQNSMGLPPVRGSEHKIELQQGCEPMNVRPYRYPQYQKKMK